MIHFPRNLFIRTFANEFKKINSLKREEYSKFNDSFWMWKTWLVHNHGKLVMEKLTVEHFDDHVKEAPGSELKTHS